MIKKNFGVLFYAPQCIFMSNVSASSRWSFFTLVRSPSQTYYRETTLCMNALPRRPHARVSQSNSIHLLSSPAASDTSTGRAAGLKGGGRRPAVCSSSSVSLFTLLHHASDPSLQQLKPVRCVCSSFVVISAHVTQFLHAVLPAKWGDYPSRISTWGDRSPLSPRLRRHWLKVKRYSSPEQVISELWRHLPCGITQCYLPSDTSEHAPPNPARQAGTRFTEIGQCFPLLQRL